MLYIHHTKLTERVNEIENKISSLTAELGRLANTVKHLSNVEDKYPRYISEIEGEEDEPKFFYHFVGVGLIGGRTVEATLVYFAHSKIWGASWCAPEDQFCKRTGRLKAESSLERVKTSHQSEEAPTYLAAYEAMYGFKRYPSWASKVQWWPRYRYYNLSKHKK